MAHRIVLHSPLTPAALARKLRAVLGARKAEPSKAGVTGQGSEEDMLLFCYRPNFQNSFATRLSATMAAAGGGTRIEGTIGTPGGALVFIVCWFGFLTLFLAVAGVGMIASHAPLEDTLVFVAIPAGMMLFGWLLWRLGTWNAKKDEAAILDFLSATISARPE